MTALQLLPLVPSGSTPTRTTTDRLEVLTALLAAPTVDPMFREDIIVMPRDHPVYGWACGVPACERPLAPHRDYCHTHDLQWLALRKQGMSVTEFQRTAEPLTPQAWFTPPPCLICPDVPAWTMDGLCYTHSHRWDHYRGYYRRLHGREVDFDTWLRDQSPFPAFGQCLVEPCPELADNPLRLCRRHSTRYQKAGRPGGAASPSNWTRWLDRGESIPVEYADKASFDRWCRETGLANRMNGKVSLLGLRPLVKAEIHWTMFHHGNGPEEASQWPLAWLQYVADDCRTQRVNSLVDLDLNACRAHAATIASLMLKYLRLVYFTREDTKDAGFIETDHFGVRFPGTRSHFDLTLISQRWLRDLVWDAVAARLTADPPRSRTTFETHRRGCVELSAFLEAQAPGGGHDPTTLTAAHMTDFIADQRYRAQHGLKSLGAHTRGRGPDGGPTLVTRSTPGGSCASPWNPARPNGLGWPAASSSPCRPAATKPDGAGPSRTTSPGPSRMRTTCAISKASIRATAGCGTLGKPSSSPAAAATRSSNWVAGWGQCRACGRVEGLEWAGEGVRWRWSTASPDRAGRRRGGRARSR